MTMNSSDGSTPRTPLVRLLSVTAGVLLGVAATTWWSSASAAEATKAAADAPKAAKPAKPVRKPPTKKEIEQMQAKRLAPLPEATPEQMEAARRVHIGRYICEFDKMLGVDANDTNLGYFSIRHGNKVWVTRPVLSSTGAIRLEDVDNQVLLVQIRTKSMLLNTKTGERIVDACVHEIQREAEEELRRNPPEPALLK